MGIPILWAVVYWLYDLVTEVPDLIFGSARWFWAAVAMCALVAWRLA